jgi:elongator complex protein 3
VKDGKIKNYQLRITNYKASGGREYFIEACSKDKKVLYGFCRLRLVPRNMEHITHNIIQGMALIRELHVYGELVSVPSTSSGQATKNSGLGKKVQHEGLGKKLMIEAEKIAKKNKFKTIAVISGIGARGYYKKLGYKLDKTYMIKEL